MSANSDEYYSIEAPSTGMFKDQKSKFYAFAYPVESEAEVKRLLENVRNEYHDASILFDDVLINDIKQGVDVIIRDHVINLSALLPSGNQTMAAKHFQLMGHQRLGGSDKGNQFGDVMFFIADGHQDF